MSAILFQPGCVNGYKVVAMSGDTLWWLLAMESQADQM